MRKGDQVFLQHRYYCALLDSELDFLYGLMREGVKLDLEIMRGFSEAMGSPQDSFRSVHIAGTNGKGSTASFIYNILRQRHNTGLYTSPHLVKFNERIVYNLEQIDDDYIRQFVRDHRSTILELAKSNRNPTFFETTTMLALDFFKSRKADFAVLEVGLGGRLDSTNIVNPVLSVITQIGYEHADKLGCSLTSIATEKGGIIKEGVPVVLSDEKPEVVKTIRSIASVRNSNLILTWKESEISNLEISEEGTSFSLRTPAETYDIRSPLLGDFQAGNISTAVVSIENCDYAKFSRKDVEKGISESRWPARLEIVRSDPKVVLDSSHNPPAAISLVRTFRKIFREKPLLVVGMLSDKDAYSYLSVLKGLSDKIIFTSPLEEKRAMDPEKMDRLYGYMFREHNVVKNPWEAYERAKEKSALILVTGSMYLVGLIKELEDREVMPYKLN